MTLEERKAEAKKNFKETRATYISNPTNENWINFCNAKKACMLLGVII